MVGDSDGQLKKQTSMFLLLGKNDGGWCYAQVHSQLYATTNITAQLYMPQCALPLPLSLQLPLPLPLPLRNAQLTSLITKRSTQVLKVFAYPCKFLSSDPFHAITMRK